MNDWLNFCLTYFHPKKVVRWVCCDCNSMAGKSYAGLRYIEKGSVTFTVNGNVLSASEGDVLFIPNGARYYAVWKGEPEVVFYSIDFNFVKSSGASLDNQYALSVVKGDVQPQIRDLIMDAYKAKDGTKTEIMARFYGLLGTLMGILPYSEGNELPSCVRLALAYIEKNYKSEFKGADLARACFVSESRLYHQFSLFMKCSPVTYKNRLKVNDAISLLTQTEMRIEEIASALNFHSSTYFRKVFKSMMGMYPLEYRKKNGGYLS